MDTLTTTTSEVAKFGGTSMAAPEQVVAQLEYSSDATPVVVCSAPGLDKEHGYYTKVTDMLRSDDPAITELLQARYALMARRLDPSETDHALQQVVADIPHDLERWRSYGWPVAGLGEYWSARMLAAHTGREFVDATEIIRFDENGQLDEATSSALIKERLLPGRKYVVPGYYGARHDGQIELLERGGSDITGALIARALEADEYHNWSDVPGFMTADPNVLPQSLEQMLQVITYQEARDLGIGGSELLHREASRILLGTAVSTVMRNTFGRLGNRGTRIENTRDFLNTPVVGVTGSMAVGLSTRKFGRLNEEVGGIDAVLQPLKERGISLGQVVTGVDNTAVYVPIANPGKSDEAFAEYQSMIADISEVAELIDGEHDIWLAGMVHIIGEGIARSGIARAQMMGQLGMKFADVGISLEGFVDARDSATATAFIEIDQSTDPAYAIGSVQRALAVAHNAVLGFERYPI